MASILPYICCTVELTQRDEESKRLGQTSGLWQSSADKTVKSKCQNENDAVWAAWAEETSFSYGPYCSRQERYVVMSFSKLNGINWTQISGGSCLCKNILFNMRQISRLSTKITFASTDHTERLLSCCADYQVEGISVKFLSNRKCVGVNGHSSFEILSWLLWVLFVAASYNTVFCNCSPCCDKEFSIFLGTVVCWYTLIMMWGWLGYCNFMWPEREKVFFFFPHTKSVWSSAAKQMKQNDENLLVDIMNRRMSCTWTQIWI